MSVVHCQDETRGNHDNVCLAGGAEGADLLFGQLATAAGHQVVHYGFQGMRSKVELCVLNGEDLQQANLHISQATEFLDRRPPRKPHVLKLIQRNYFQVKTADSIYVITRWNLVDRVTGLTEEGKLGGGTGWAIAMGIALKLPNIFLFAIEKCQWYRYSYEAMSWMKVDALNIPAPQGRYAGIGSRELDEVGEKALRSLYGTDGTVS